MTLDELIKTGTMLTVMLSVALNLYLFRKAKADDRFERVNDRADRIAKALAEEIAERREQGASLEKDHAVLAATVAGLPTHDDLSEIREELTNQTRTLASVDQRSKTTLTSVERIENYLLGHRK